MATSEEIARLEKRHELNAYVKLPIAAARGEGVWLFDAEGRRYLDFYGGHAVSILGYGHPDVVRAVREQAERLTFCSSLFPNETRARFLEALVGFAGGGRKAFLVNSGSEANECALKLARMFRGREQIVAIQGGFHGRTMGALSATGLEPYRRKVSPLVPRTVFARFGEIGDVEQALGSETAAVILEPVQSMAGVRPFARDYLLRLEELCRARAAVLIFDEIQTGLGRVGARTAADLFGVRPHVITFAKGLGSGVPIAAMLVEDQLAESVKPGDQGSTFGGGPIACAAGLATLGVLERERLWENAARQGERLRERLARLPGVVLVRGHGLLLGVELDRPAKQVQAALLANGVVVGTASPEKTMRLLPPLTIADDHVDELVSKLGEALRTG